MTAIYQGRGVINHRCERCRRDAEEGLSTPGYIYEIRFAGATSRNPSFRNAWRNRERLASAALTPPTANEYIDIQIDREMYVQSSKIYTIFLNLYSIHYIVHFCNRQLFFKYEFSFFFVSLTANILYTDIHSVKSQKRNCICVYIARKM